MNIQQMSYNAARWIAHVRGLDESAIDALAQRTAEHFAPYIGFENVIRQADVIQQADWYAGEFETRASDESARIENTTGDVRLQDLL